MSFDFKTAHEVGKIEKKSTDRKRLFLPFMIFCLPVFGFFAILVGDFRYAKSRCNSFSVPAKFLIFSILSLIFPILLTVCGFIPVVGVFFILGLFVIPYKYAKFHSEFSTEAVRRFG